MEEFYENGKGGHVLQSSYGKKWVDGSGTKIKSKYTAEELTNDPFGVAINELRNWEMSMRGQGLLAPDIKVQLITKDEKDD